MVAEAIWPSESSPGIAGVTRDGVSRKLALAATATRTASCRTARKRRRRIKRRQTPSVEVVTGWRY